MTTYEIIPASPKAIPVTRRPRRGGALAVVQGHIHSTRGPVPMELQIQAMMNWFGNNRPWPHGNNHGSWGGSADYGIGPLNGKTVIVQFGDWLRTFSSWSAGFGNPGPSMQYGAAEHAVAIELAQPPTKTDPAFGNGQYVSGDSDVPFEEETLDALTWLVGRINETLVSAGGVAIPAVRIPYWNQSLSEPVPAGWMGHQDTDNGRDRGKSDPGVMFDWRRFINAIDVPELGGPMSPPIGNYAATIAAWRNGVTPLPMDGRQARYELRPKRS